ncbi:MAG: hypothetical protein ACP5TV_13030, partial [Anaerolineae bacterium]
MRAERSGRTAGRLPEHWPVLAASIIVGVIVPLVLTLPARLLAALGLLPAVILLWMPELAVVLM